MNKPRNNFLILSTIYLFTFLFTGCDDTLSDDSLTMPASGVSYSKHIAPLFQLKCNNSACHGDGASGRPVFTSHYGITKDASIVVKGDPETSRLVWAIEWRGGAAKMPPEGSAGLTTAQITGIKTWIKEGAQNN
ncbi:MAG: hypothetical protein HYV28_20875 [Ignavibacteriales bacterium]|nr:hypothetical protein [Ignavibacteriales bacterium]